MPCVPVRQQRAVLFFFFFLCGNPANVPRGTQAVRLKAVPAKRLAWRRYSVCGEVCFRVVRVKARRACVF